MLNHYFPYHQKIDQLTDCTGVRIAFDCHSMLPFGLPGQMDAGKARSLICLGNNGDGKGEPHPGSITTCPPDGSGPWKIPLSVNFLFREAWWRSAIHSPGGSLQTPITGIRESRGSRLR